METVDKFYNCQEFHFRFFKGNSACLLYYFVSIVWQTAFTRETVKSVKSKKFRGLILLMLFQAGRRPSSLDVNSETTYVSVQRKPIVSGNIVWKPLPAALPAACERKAHGI
jgi:hypothetical protein